MDLNSVPWDRYLSNCDPNDGWYFFRNTLNKLLQKHIPMITIKDKAQPPWFDCETLNLCKKKERLRRKFKASGLSADYTRFSQCRKKLKALIKSKMQVNLNDDENDPSLISKKNWGHVKQLVNQQEFQNLCFINTDIEIIQTNKLKFLMNFLLTSFLKQALMTLI